MNKRRIRNDVVHTETNSMSTNIVHQRISKYSQIIPASWYIRVNSLLKTIWNILSGRFHVWLNRDKLIMTRAVNVLSFVII